jgi:outer membrane immunogenic protein
MMKMKQYLLASALCGLPFAASAADLPVKAPVYTAPVVVVYNWTGWYAGGNIGYGWGNADANYTDPGFAIAGLPTSFSGSEKLDGVIGGGQIGYNWQANSTWVFGLEADFQGSGQKGSRSFSNSYIFDCEGTCTGNINQNQETKIQWFGTVRGRVGVLVNPTILLYGTGGLAYGRISASGTVTDTGICACSWSYGNSTTKVGWTLGAGIEGAIPNTRDWTWKVEYLYIDFGSVSGNGFDFDSGTAFSWSAKVTDNIVRVGVNYRFH